MRRGEQAAEIRVPAPRLDEQRDVRAAVERDLRAGDRPHAERLRRVRELERAVDAVVVGERERLVSELRRARRELLRLRRAVEERVRRVAVELDVAGHLGCGNMVEIGEGERHLRRAEARRDAPRGHRAARRGRGARRTRLGKDAACTSTHDTPRRFYVFEGELTLRLEDREQRVGPRPGCSSRPRSCTRSR